MVAPNSPALSAAGFRYMRGWEVSYLDNTQLLIYGGSCRDSQNINDIVNNVVITVDLTKSGVNGIDSGVVQANKHYAVYAIGSSNNPNVDVVAYAAANPLNPNGYAPNLYPPACILSLSFEKPELPFGYDMYRRIGFVRTDNAAPTPHFLPFVQYGVGSERRYYYTNPVLVLDGPGAIVNTQVLLEVGVGADVGVPACPPIRGEVLVQVRLSVVGDVRLQSADTSSVTGVVCAALPGADHPSSLYVPTQFATATAVAIKYAASAGDIKIHVVGFLDSLV